MTVAHHLPLTRFIGKPFSATALAVKGLESLKQVRSHLSAPSGDLLLNVAFGAIALYGATMVVSLLTL